jgi:photosystem II stability/assembly factor-like uncharacterized protein
MPVRIALLRATGTLLALALLSHPCRGEEPFAPIMPRASRALLLDIAAVGSRAVAVGERGIALYSDDAGASWQQAKVPTWQMLTAVFFPGAQRGWAVGHDGLILASDDRGASWQLQRDGLAAQQRANLAQQKTALRRVQQLEQALAAAPGDARAAPASRLEEARLDLEDAQSALEEPVFTSPLMDVWFQDGARGWAVGAFGTLLGTTDAGQHWASLAGEIDNPEERHLNAITGDGRGRVLIAGEGGVLYRSLDGGGHWQALPPVYDGSWFGAAYSAATDSLLLCGLQGSLYRSRDFGDSWEAVPSGTGLGLAGAAASADGRRISIVGAVGTLLESRDGGQTFTPRALAQRPGLSSALYLDDRLILVGQGGVLTLAEGAR